MKRILLPMCVALAMMLALQVHASPGLVELPSKYSVTETADRFEALLREKGFTVFNRIDHQENAAAVGLELRPTTVLIFGNPKVGTKLMQCAQNVAIDLPQKVLISQSSDENVMLTFNDPDYLRGRHSMEGCEAVIQKVSQVLNGLGRQAVQ